jgi:hypothetical protein
MRISPKKKSRCVSNAAALLFPTSDFAPIRRA